MNQNVVENAIDDLAENLWDDEFVQNQIDNEEFDMDDQVLFSHNLCIINLNMVKYLLILSRRLQFWNWLCCFFVVTWPSKLRMIFAVDLIYFN